MTRSVEKPPNSQYYELCTCFKEIPTHDSMFRAVCVEPSPPTHLMCIDQFYAFYFLVIWLLFPPITFVSTSFCPTYKRGKTVPEFCSYVNIILHTHTLAW